LYTDSHQQASKENIQKIMRSTTPTNAPILK
jgi:hypothetical protein